MSTLLRITTGGILSAIALFGFALSVEASSYYPNTSYNSDRDCLYYGSNGACYRYRYRDPSANYERNYPYSYDDDYYDYDYNRRYNYNYDYDYDYDYYNRNYNTRTRYNTSRCAYYTSTGRCVTSVNSRYSRYYTDVSNHPYDVRTRTRYNDTYYDRYNNDPYYDYYYY